MKALSIHLRPAPYPYGLLTLRLLGKLGGKNRRVLREPIDITDPNSLLKNSVENMSVEFTWSTKPLLDVKADSKLLEGSLNESTFKIDLPIQRCYELLKRTSHSRIFDSEVILLEQPSSSGDLKEETDGRNPEALLSKDISEVDLLGYCVEIRKETTLSQVKAAIQVLRSALTKIISIPERSLALVDFKGSENKTEVELTSEAFDMQTIASGLSKYNDEFRTITIGLMFGCSITPIKKVELDFVKGLLTSVFVIVKSHQSNIVRVDANGSSTHHATENSESDDEFKEFGEEGLGSLKPFGYFELNGPLKHTTDPLTINKALSEFLTQSSPSLIDVGLNLLKHVLELPRALKASGSDDSVDQVLDRGSMIFFENLLSALCDKCIVSDWSVRNGLYKGINMMVKLLGQSWAKRYETEIMNVALYAVKSVPGEMSIAGIKSFEFLVELCSNLYGKIEISKESKMPFTVDMLSLLRSKEEKVPEVLNAVSKPRDDVMQMLINELASTSHLVR